ncbi:hypothetical protein GCM10023232_21390 [Sphingosinicella ginsenosidimutans]|jgi:hypothetical protein|uniref:Uncharacterized protein n=2 Tax=Allosphingosinicella ginsenosidimutans TaxID=1176539 RepID=A0A5C6TTN0_9SPHN|nr:hypothetical protein FRZ32_06745 [Sphingosinicella ginsenosidimutans]
MSAAMAILAISALYLLLFAPAAAALLRPKAIVAIRAIYAIFFLALAVRYFGLPGLGEPVVLAKAPAVPIEAQQQDPCVAAIAQAEARGLVTDRSNPSLVQVDSVKWRRLPPEARAALNSCLDQARSPRARAFPIQIVED